MQLAPRRPSLPRMAPASTSTIRVGPARFGSVTLSSSAWSRTEEASLARLLNPAARDCDHHLTGPCQGQLARPTKSTKLGHHLERHPQGHSLRIRSAPRSDATQAASGPESVSKWRESCTRPSAAIVLTQRPVGRASSACFALGPEP